MHLRPLHLKFSEAGDRDAVTPNSPPVALGIYNNIGYSGRLILLQNLY